MSRSRRLRLITLTETLIIPDITKTESNNCFIIQAILIFFIIEAILTSLSANLTLQSGRALDIALRNHALRAQPTDYSLICRYRLVNNL